MARSKNLSRFAVPAFVATVAGMGIDLMGNILPQWWPDAPHYVWTILIAISFLMIAAFPIWLILTMVQWAMGKLPNGEEGRGSLNITGPNLFQDKRYVNSRRYRMNVHNRGVATATNVQMKCNISHHPQSVVGQADYPYRIVQVGHTLNANDCYINPDNDAIFEAMQGWSNEAGMLFVGIDTNSGDRNPIPIQGDEHVKFDYIVTAENADPVKFTLEANVENGAVIAKQKN